MPRRRPPPRPSDSWDPTLDLHGQTAAEARRLTERWLRQRRAEGEVLVRVITGRGLHSVGPPVLRGEIEELLRHLTGTLVQAFNVEPGGGSYRIELVRGAGRARPRPRPATPPVDPALRRAAEEALVELGITPTPALVEAEIRRMLGG